MMPFSIAPTVKKAQVYDSRTGRMIQQEGNFTDQEIDAGAGRFPGGLQFAPGTGTGGGHGGGGDNWQGPRDGMTGAPRIRATPGGAPSHTTDGVNIDGTPGFGQGSGLFGFYNMQRGNFGAGRVDSSMITNPSWGGVDPWRTDGHSWNTDPSTGGERGIGSSFFAGNQQPQKQQHFLQGDGIPHVGNAAKNWSNFSSVPTEGFQRFAGGGSISQGQTGIVNDGMGMAGASLFTAPSDGVIVPAPAGQSQEGFVPSWSTLNNEFMSNGHNVFAEPGAIQGGQNNVLRGLGNVGKMQVQQPAAQPQQNDTSAYQHFKAMANPNQALIDQERFMRSPQGSMFQMQSDMGQQAAQNKRDMDVWKQGETTKRWTGREDASMDRLKESQRGIAERLADTQKMIDARQDRVQKDKFSLQGNAFANSADIAKAKKAEADTHEQKVSSAHESIAAELLHKSGLEGDEREKFAARLDRIMKYPPAIRQTELNHLRSAGEKKAASAELSPSQLHNMQQQAYGDIKKYREDILNQDGTVKGPNPDRNDNLKSAAWKRVHAIQQKLDAHLGISPDVPPVASEAPAEKAGIKAGATKSALDKLGN